MCKKVFISYSHDSEDHKQYIRELADRLRSQQGFDCYIDQYLLPSFPPEGWIKWMRDHINQADYVLLICTPLYRKRYERNLEAIEGGKGVAFEGLLISQILYNQYFRNTKFIPIILEKGSYGDVPLELQDYITYQLPDSYQMLCDLIKGIKYCPPPSITSFTLTKDQNLELFVDHYLKWLEDDFFVAMELFTIADGEKQFFWLPPSVVCIEAETQEKIKYSTQNIKKNEFSNLLDALTISKRGIFLGKPNTGKSTALWRVAYEEVTKNRFRAREERIVPIVIKFGLWIDKDQNLEDYIRTQIKSILFSESKDDYTINHVVEVLIKNNRTILLFDSLNSIPIPQRLHKTSQIVHFLNKNNLVRCYFTCRESDYTDSLKLPLKSFYFQEPENNKIKAFIYNKFKFISVNIPQLIKNEEIYQQNELDENSRGFIEKVLNFLRGIKNDNLDKNIYQSIGKIINDFYLIKLLNKVNSPQEKTCINNATLIENYNNFLFVNEELLQKQNEIVETKNFLSSLAWHMTKKSQATFPLKIVLEMFGSAKNQIDIAIKTNILTIDKDLIYFKKSLMQEYFTALALLKEKSKLGDHIYDQGPSPYIDIANQEISYWDESLILLAGLQQNDCSDTVAKIGQNNPLLAARCIIESGSECNSSLTANIFDSLKKISYEDESFISRNIRKAFENYLRVSKSTSTLLSFEGNNIKDEPSIINNNLNKYKVDNDSTINVEELSSRATGDYKNMSTEATSYAYQIELWQDLKSYLYQFQERLQGVSNKYQNKVNDLREAGMMREDYVRFSENELAHTQQMISGLVEHINNYDIPKVQKEIAELELKI